MKNAKNPTPYPYAANVAKDLVKLGNICLLQSFLLSFDALSKYQQNKQKTSIT